MAHMPEGETRRMYSRFETNSTAWVRRVSEEPAAILGYQPLAVNDKIAVLFDLPFISKRRIHKQAHVAWCSHVKEGLWEAGLDFGLDNMLLLR